MKAINKGEIPLNLIDKIFGYFWKSQMNTVLKVYLAQFKPGKNFTINSKTVFEKFFDDIFGDCQKLLQDKNILMNTYTKIKGIFPIILESEWEKAWPLF